jgi:MYXO-CTERM domain-containing protein
MNPATLQTIIWILALVILVLFLRRRRNRRAQQR